MENLAGRQDCDQFIEQELKRAMIKVVKLSKPLDAEVPASIIGRLGSFKFERAWYYWTVKGRVPLCVAKELYKDPVGRTDIRVAGHCGCPRPRNPWVEWFGDDGKQLLPLSQKAEFERHELPTEGYVFVEDPSQVG